MPAPGLGDDVTPITGDGYQLMRVASAVSEDDPWLVTGEDAGRFRFEIITSGTEAMNLQATGGEGKVDLSWFQDDFDLLAGYNLYRSLNPSNNFGRLNSWLIPAQQKTYRDTGVQLGQPYYYRFKVVKTDMTESDFSNTAQGTPLDTIPPVLTHTPVTSAPPGLPLTLFADVTDKVGVQAVTLFFRATGTIPYLSRAMTRTTGNRFAATIEGLRLNSPGLEYYIEATDGVSTVRNGRPELPNAVSVVDRPVVTGVSPVRGTAVSVVTFVSSSQLTCVTPAHFPATADVKVTNPDGQSGTLLRAFVFESDTVSLSLPNTGGAQWDLVQVPINAANLAGLAAADFTVTFNASVLRGRGARAGSLTSGWSLAVNTNTAGQLRLSLANPGAPVSGDGTIALIELEVIGAPGSLSPLQLANVSLNSGERCDEGAGPGRDICRGACLQGHWQHTILERWPLSIWRAAHARRGSGVQRTERRRWRLHGPWRADWALRAYPGEVGSGGWDQRI
jgi:hypothetical protein